MDSPPIWTPFSRSPGAATSLWKIEDAAQAHGAEYHGRRVGAIGDIGCFSFYPAKNLGAGGEGGAVVTNNPEYARIMRLLRDWGSEEKYVHSMHGYNYRIEGLQGAILRVKLRHLDAWTGTRCRNAALYSELLAGSGAVLPGTAPSVRHVWHCYTIRVTERDHVQQELLRLGVQTGVHYPIPIHLQPAYADLGYGRGDFPAAELAAAEVLALPIHSELTEQQVRRVATPSNRPSPRWSSAAHQASLTLMRVQLRNLSVRFGVSLAGGNTDEKQEVAEMENLLLTSGLLLGTILTGCAGGGYYTSARIGPPPPPRYGVRGLAPGPGYVWEEGFWGSSRRPVGLAVGSLDARAAPRSGLGPE